MCNLSSDVWRPERIHENLLTLFFSPPCSTACMPPFCVVDCKTVRKLECDLFMANTVLRDLKDDTVD